MCVTALVVTVLGTVSHWIQLLHSNGYFCYQVLRVWQNVCVTTALVVTVSHWIQLLHSNGYFCYQVLCVWQNVCVTALVVTVLGTVSHSHFIK